MKFAIAFKCTSDCVKLFMHDEIRTSIAGCAVIRVYIMTCPLHVYSNVCKGEPRRIDGFLELYKRVKYAYYFPMCECISKD